MLDQRAAKERKMAEAARRAELVFAEAAEKRALEAKHKLDIVLRNARQLQAAQDEAQEAYIETAARIERQQDFQDSLVAGRRSSSIQLLLGEYRSGNPIYAKALPKALVPPNREGWCDSGYLRLSRFRKGVIESVRKSGITWLGGAANS